MKKLFLALLLVCSSLTLYSQDTTGVGSSADTVWRTGGVFNVQFSQVSLTNWAAGGDNSLALNSLAGLFANYKQGKVAWDNTLDLGYSLMKQGDEDVRKSDDKIELNSKVGREAWNKFWYYSFLFNFKSQFANGYAYPNDSVVISSFAAPAYALASFGLDYKPNPDFSFFFSPLTAKFTIVTDQDLADAGAYGVDSAEYDINSSGNLVKTKDGENLRSEFGAYINTRYTKVLMENISLGLKADFFSNYSENPQNIDVNADLLISMKVNRFITASLGMTLIYDDDIAVPIYEGSGVNRRVVRTGPRTQLRQTFGVGLAFNFAGYDIR